MGIKLDWSVKAGDVLTCLAILASALVLFASWSKDRTAKEAERADQFRAAAARAITKLDRWQALQLSFYQELQPVFVETGEALRDKRDTVRIRDQLWKSIAAERNRIASRILEEQFETAYAELLPRYPEARVRFVEAFAKLGDIERITTASFLKETQGDVFEFQGRKQEYVTAALGNALRATARTHKDKLKAGTDTVLQPIRDYLYGIIAHTDDQILNASRNP